MQILKSLNGQQDFHAHYVGVGWEPPALPNITVSSLSDEQNKGAPPETHCIQHGSFLHVVGGKPDDVILYCDGDMTRQRDLDDDELDMLNLRHGQVCVGQNGGPAETLVTEAYRLIRKKTIDELAHEWGPIIQWPIYNVGCLAMTRQTWGELHELYMKNWQKATSSFGHQARQQWLICWCIPQLGFEVVNMPQTFHVHGHFGLPPGTERRRDGVYHNGRLSVFRHYL